MWRLRCIAGLQYAFRSGQAVRCHYIGRLDCARTFSNGSRDSNGRDDWLPLWLRMGSGDNAAPPPGDPPRPPRKSSSRASASFSAHLPTYGPRTRGVARSVTLEAAIRLNKRIRDARDAVSILTIVETEHGEFNSVNAATACSRLAKTRQRSAYGPRMDDRRMQTLFYTVARESVDMGAREVSNTVWALAKLGWEAEDGVLRSALEGAVVRVAPSMSAQAVANTLSALASLRWQAGEGAMRALEAAAVREVPIMNAQDVANTLWALATLRWQAEAAAMHALERAAVREAPSMNAQNVSNTLWALATLGWHAGEASMRPALEGAAVRVAQTMNAQDVANTLLALATLGWRASVELASSFDGLAKALLGNFNFLNSEGFSKLELRQLWRAHHASELLDLDLIKLPPPMLQLARTAHRDDSREASVSQAHRDVGECLDRLGIPHEREHTVSAGLPRVDLAIADRRIAIEFDGPSHFTVNTLERLGHTRLRDRLLAAVGWHVVSIPFFEWAKLRRNDYRDAYVRQRLESPPAAAHTAAIRLSAPQPVLLSASARV